MRVNKVEICGINTAELRTLSEDEKRALLMAAREGDTSAREAMVMGNLRLVLSIIQKFNQKKDSLDDLFQVGCIGLIKAIDNFNLDLDVRFSTYAVPMIIGELRRYQRDNSSLRVSRGVRDLAFRALGVKEEFIRSRGREATLAEIAQRLEVTEREVGEAMEAIAQPISLFDSVYGDGDDAVYVIDKLADDSDGDDAEYMKGKRVLIVDDVISTGGSLLSLEHLVEMAGGKIVGKMTILAEGDAIDRKDIICLGKLPLFDKDGNEL